MADDTLDRLRNAMPEGVSIGSRLDAGGQGSVFEGDCDGAVAAIKVFKTDADTRRIDREIDLLSRVTCPHVVRLLRHFSITIDNEPARVLAYELHRGGDLRRHLSVNAPPLGTTDLVKIGIEVGTAINTLWSARIVHRDIKPANIVRTGDGRHVLVDLGLARHLELADLTVGGPPGTRGFRSPEQARGRRALTVHSDVFSLGVTLYALASKKHPFANQDILRPLPIDLTPLASYPPQLAKLIGSMLSFTPAMRPVDVVDQMRVIGGT